ncbi:uncharacterized protein LOC119956439 isoform X3 [Scyliorhinus canicula]|uniref:uncharacterized protein LOC119956439 isoform X3 n=1 Tax=Scyliorhinus canicula TaxID=7830 RepID=UPI0018F55F04|nr:uncharacterized protein LOC119956439 isoform X3 [Scyliorhinus canicula]
MKGMRNHRLMEPQKEPHHKVLHHRMRSYSFDSFFQHRWTQEKECSGLNRKWRNSVDCLMCDKEQCSVLSDAVVKKTLSFPSTGTRELVREIIAKDSIEKSSDMNTCSEEDVLNCTFESCDIEGKGEVYVSRIIGYLEDVTGQSCEKGQLKLLHKMLNPEEKDIAVNLGTFHNIMKQWIAECRQEGFSNRKNEEATPFENICILQTDKKSDTTSGQLEGYGGDVNRGNLETTELINDIERLEYTNKKLVDQNAKLQRSVEGCEEANVRLTEEIFDLKNKLKSSQQVLLHVKLLENELEDLKSIAKNLEDRNYKLQSHNRQLEKEQQNLSMRIFQLQEENGKLTAEKDYTHWRNEELVSEKAELKNQVYEANRLISVKDVLLTEKINQSEELKSTVDEYNNIIKGLKEEINRLQCHLTCEDVTVACGLHSVELQSATAPVRAPEHSLQLEIEEIQQKTDLAANSLPTPLCGMVPLSDSAGQIKDILYRICSQLNRMDFQAINEELFMQQEVEEEATGFLQKISSLFRNMIVWDMYKGNLASQKISVTRHCQATEGDSNIRNVTTEENKYPAVEKAIVNAIPPLKRLKEHQWNMLTTERVSDEGLGSTGSIFNEIDVQKKTHRNTLSWQIFEEEDDKNKRSTGAAQESLSFTVENDTGQATETEWQFEFQMSPKHCTLHVDESSQKVNKTKCATSSMPVQFQRFCQSSNHDTGQMELLCEELFLRNKKSTDNSYIKWNVVQSDSAVMGPAEQMQVALLEQHPMSRHYRTNQTRALRYEDQSALFTRFCSQVKNISLVCLLVIFTMMLVAFFSLFSLLPWSCQKHQFAECTDNNFWSVVKALLCPQIRLRHEAPPPV